MELFNSLSKDYCNIFYVYSIFGLFSALFLFISFIYMVVKKPTKNWHVYSVMLLGVGAYILVYLRERLFYNMCLKA